MVAMATFLCKNIEVHNWGKTFKSPYLYFYLTWRIGTWTITMLSARAILVAMAIFSVNVKVTV